MAYKILKAGDFQARFKATVHKSGKLGFTDATAKELGFESKSAPYVKFAVDEDDPSLLYLINMKEGDEDSFRVSKAGSYYYVNTRLMFDSLQVDYVKETVIYDMVRIANDENGVYRMTKRIIKRNKKEEKEIV